MNHVNKCKELPFSSSTSLSQAKDYFREEFKDALISKEDPKTAPLRPMKGPPMRIHLNDDAVPFTISSQCQISFAFRNKVKKELNSFVKQACIKPAGDEPLEWCQSLVVVAKSNAEVSLTVVLSKLSRLKPSAV